MFADMKPFVLFGRINRADADACTGLLHFNLNFLRERLGFLMRAGLRADDGGDFYLAPRFTVNFDLSEFVLDANRLAGA